MKRIALTLAALLMATTTAAQAQPEDAPLRSTKQPADLELCVGEAVSRYAIPSILQGSEATVILGTKIAGLLNQQFTVIRVELRKVPDGTMVFMAAGPQWDDRLRKRIQTCL